MRPVKVYKIGFDSVTAPGDRSRLEPQDPSDEPGGDRPACAGEEAYTEPDTDEVEVDGGGHGAILLMPTPFRFANGPRLSTH